MKVEISVTSIHDDFIIVDVSDNFEKCTIKQLQDFAFKHVIDIVKRNCEKDNYFLSTEHINNEFGSIEKYIKAVSRWVIDTGESYRVTEGARVDARVEFYDNLRE